MVVHDENIIVPLLPEILWEIHLLQKTEESKVGWTLFGANHLVLKQ